MPSEPRHPGRIYGWAARIGLIVPPTNSTNEAEWQQALPEGVTLHVARMPLHLDSDTPDGRRALEADLARAASDLATADADVIAYGCTAGSLGLPLDSLTGLITGLTGRPAVATAPAIGSALKRRSARRIALATPYHDALNRHEAAFFAACGFDVAAVKGLGIGAGGPHEFRAIAGIRRETIMELIDGVDGPDIDAIVLSCTDLPTRYLHDDIERRIGKPLITSNQATFDAVLECVAEKGQERGRP
jgi:maleate cis-trans isomerase